MDLFDSLYSGTIDEEKDLNDLLDMALRKHFPCLHDFIVKRSHNGFKRDHGRITFTAENGKFKIVLSDPTGQCSFGMLCENFDDGLRSMENHAATSAIHWYYWPNKNGQKRKKQKAVTSSDQLGDS